MGSVYYSSAHLVRVHNNTLEPGKPISLNEARGKGVGGIIRLKKKCKHTIELEQKINK